MTYRLILASLVALLPYLVGCSTTQKLVPNWANPSLSDADIDRQLSVARLGERHDQVSTAESIYRKVLNEHENNTTALHRLGVMAAKDQRLEDATDLLQRALEQEPNNPEILADLGYAHFLNDDLEQAEDFFNKALEIDSRHERVHNNLGQLLAQKGNWEASLKHFRRSVDEDEAYANLAFMQAQLGEIKLSETSFHHAVSIDPNNKVAGEGLLQLASAKSRAGMTDADANAVKVAQVKFETDVREPEATTPQPKQSAKSVAKVAVSAPAKPSASKPSEAKAEQTPKQTSSRRVKHTAKISG